MNELVTKVGEYTPDNLIAKLEPSAQTFGITIAAAAEETEIKRGTLLSRGADGKYSVFAGSTAKAEFDGDGSTKKFAVSDKPETIDSVTVGGVAATISAYDKYTGEVTLSAAPAAGTKNVVVTYPVAGGEPNAILADDVTVGTSADVTGVAYRSGNFNPDAVIVPEGYTLTPADEDALRKYDIIFTQMI